MSETEPAEYYILDTRQVVGNCAMWWCPEGKGYTCDLDKAGLYPKSWHPWRETDVPVHRDVARSLAITHVRLDHLRQAGAVPQPAVRAANFNMPAGSPFDTGLDQ